MIRTEAIKTLELVGKALADQALVPIFTCFCFSEKQVFAYNDALGVIAPWPGNRPFAVHGNTLLGLLKNSHSEEVEFALDKEDATVKTGRSTFKLPYFTEGDFLFEVPKDTWAASLQINSDLVTGLEACLTTSSRDNTQPALMGVCVDQQQKHVTLYSCDGDAITRYVTSVPSKKIETLTCTMPNAFVETLIKIIAEIGLSKAGTSVLELGKDWARATLEDGYVIYGRLIENEKPLNHDALIKETIKGKVDFVALPKDLDHALARARIVADPESAKTVLTVEAGRLKLMTQAQAGVVRDSLAMGKHQGVQACVSAALVQRSIALCDEMAVHENCSIYRAGDTLLQIVSNMSG